MTINALILLVFCYVLVYVYTCFCAGTGDDSVPLQLEKPVNLLEKPKKRSTNRVFGPRYLSHTRSRNHVKNIHAGSVQGINEEI